MTLLMVRSCASSAGVRFPIRWNSIRLRALLLVTIVSSLLSSQAAAIDLERGKQIYQKQCANCHGADGEGVADKYDEPLHGDMSLSDLVDVIIETMPQKKPELCVGDDAKAVGQYIYETFYTVAARARQKPPRVEVVRLTSSQYRHSVADLISSFTGRSNPSDEAGLSAEYYASRSMRGDKRAAKQIDPQVDFDYGMKAPEFEKIKPEEFSMRWRGSIYIRESGEYEFGVTSENGVRLWVNDLEKALIDGWVSSGQKVEHKKTVRLLGGRYYPLRLDFFKFKDKTASISLRWRPPHQSWSTIPERVLTSREVKPKFIVTTAFPADDESFGYRRGISVSKAWDEATTYAAVEVATFVSERLVRVKPNQSKDKQEREYREFCRRFCETAFRRPLTEEQTNRYIDKQFSKAKDFSEALKRCVILTLKSPRFLYLELNGGSPDAYSIASRLSYALWDSIPDRILLDAARKGQLRTEAQIRTQARRMLADSRCRGKMDGFFQTWLPMEESEDVTKDAKAFPKFDEETLTRLRVSLELFLDQVVWSERSDYRELLLADYLYLDKSLAEFYGVKWEGGDEFQRIGLKHERRAGVLTHPYLLTGLAYHKSTSPIHRGVFLTRKILSRSLKPPPMAIEFMDGDANPNQTMRQRVEALTSSTACQNCHRIINPLGFSLEHFDSVGRFRTKEGVKPINAKSDYKAIDGTSVAVGGPRDVAEYAAKSKHAQVGFVSHLFHHMVKQPINAYPVDANGVDASEALRSQFEASEFHIQKLIVSIATKSAMHGVKTASKK